MKIPEAVTNERAARAIATHIESGARLQLGPNAYAQRRDRAGRGLTAGVYLAGGRYAFTKASKSPRQEPLVLPARTAAEVLAVAGSRGFLQMGRHQLVTPWAAVLRAHLRAEPVDRIGRFCGVLSLRKRLVLISEDTDNDDASTGRTKERYFLETWNGGVSRSVGPFMTLPNVLQELEKRGAFRSA